MSGGSSLRRLHGEEHGAVLMIVALSMVALIGMLVLVFDLGRVAAVRRDQVNAADAAVLAAARECAIAHNAAQARAAADSLNTQNSAGATIGTFTAPECIGDPNQRLTQPQFVTLDSTITVQYYFAQIFGMNSGPVTTRAVAEWGPVAGGNAVPISVNYQTLLDCGIPTNPPPEGSYVDCPLSYPKDTLQEPRWGILDLSHWNDPNAAPCRVSASTVSDIIMNGGAFSTVQLNPPPQPTYDCIDNGLSDSVWEELEGRTLLFPVIDIPTSTGETKPGGADCMGGDPTCQIDTANVIGFILLYIPPGGVSQHGATVMVQSSWAGDALAPGVPGPAPDFGARAIRLVE